jgi:hypothetical protein
MRGMPRSVRAPGRVRGLRSRLVSLFLAAWMLVCRPWTSPSQPFIRASVIRSARLRMISTKRGRWWGSTRSMGQRMQACSC